MGNKKKVVWGVLSFSVLAGLLLTTSSHADNGIEKEHFKVDLNQEMTAISNNQKINQVGLQHNFNLQSADHLPASFIDVSLDLKNSDSTDYKIASGQGVVKVGTDTFPFTLNEQQLAVYKNTDGTEFFSGGLTGTFKGKNGDTIFVLGFDHYPSRNQTLISTFVGVLNEEKGFGVLNFGQPFLTQDLVDIIDATKQRMQETGGQKIQQ